MTKLSRPGAAAHCLAAFLRFLFRLAPVRRKVASRNLEIILPGKTRRERRRILRGTYDHLVWLGIEFMALRRNPRDVLEWVEAENPEALDDNAGGILLACHVGNWELAAAWIAQSGHKITVISRDFKKPGELGIIEDIRLGAGVKLLTTPSRMTKAVSILRRNEFLAITPDQYGGSDGANVPLFGLETSTVQGPAVFAYLTKKPIIPVFTHRVAPFRHVVRFGSPIEWDDTGSRNKTIYGITRTVNETVEQIILEAPDQWLAQHRRFRGHY
ncbi:MAG: lysophospholipid acyltransferase family protein [Synergistaceae bacterium]|nr:lysophospholipid acyltransferase family protein [Synergistaceae bacterium]